MTRRLCGTRPCSCASPSGSGLVQQQRQLPRNCLLVTRRSCGDRGCSSSALPGTAAGCRNIPRGRGSSSSAAATCPLKQGSSSSSLFSNLGVARSPARPAGGYSSSPGGGSHTVYPSLRTASLSQFFRFRLGQMSGAEAIPGTSRSIWWLQMPLYAHFKFSRVQVTTGSSNNFRGLSVPVPNISQALSGAKILRLSEAMHEACRSP